MRELLNSNDTAIIKQGDTSEVIRLSARNDNQPVAWTEDNTAEVHVETDAGAFVKKFPAKLITDSNNVLVNSEDLADLKPGKYALELWVKLSSGKNAIWPSDQALPLTISKNADDIETAGEITTIALDDFKKEVTKEIQIQAEKAGLTDQNGRKVDLTDYAKKSDVPNIVYDADSRTLTVNGVKVDLPSDVDLSGYAKKSELPKIVYDTDTRTLTVNGAKVDLPSNVDLSDCVKTEDLKGYAKKSDIPEVPTVSLDVEKRTVTVNGQTITIPNSVDLSGYAKSADVPAVKLDGRTLTINGTKITIPDTVDLSGYYTKSEVDQKLASAQTGGKVDLSGYLTVENADETYAKKTDIPAAPDLTDYVKKEDLPKEPDLSSYETKADAENTYAKKTDIPAKPDLTDYVKREDLPAAPDLSSYETKADADKIYAKKTDIPAAPNLTDYVKRETLLDYAKKSDITDLKPGKDGESAYQIWLDRGNKGDEQAFLNSLKGATGAPGKDAVGKDGRRGSAIFTTSDYINPDVNPVTASVASLKSSDSTLKPMVGDYVIATVNDETRILEITAVNADTVQFSSDMINLQGGIGSQGLQGHSIWLVDGSISASVNIPVASLIGHTTYGTQPESNDVLISKDGDVSTIDSFSYGNTDPMTGQATITGVTPGRILGHFGSQSDEPTNATFDYDKLPKLTIVDQNKLGDYLGLDSSKSYTLDVDNFTLNDGTTDTEKFLKPGIYLLRDVANHGYNLTIKSSSNMAGTYANPVQLIVTPYTVIATAAEGSQAGWFIRTDWSHDSMDYWGIDNGWIKLAEGKKSGQ